MLRKNRKNTEGRKNSSLVIFLVVLIALVTCALAGYTLYEMKNMRSQIATAGGGKHEAPKSQDSSVPTYVPLDSFTVSLKPVGGDEDRVLFIGLTLRVKDTASQQTLLKYMPEVRSRLLLLFSHKTAEDLSSTSGKNELVHDIITDLDMPFATNQRATISDVLFNDFILR